MAEIDRDYDEAIYKVSCQFLSLDLFFNSLDRHKSSFCGSSRFSQQFGKLNLPLDTAREWDLTSFILFSQQQVLKEAQVCK